MRFAEPLYLTFFLSSMLMSCVSCESANRSELIEILDIEEGDVVADIGAGEGDWTDELVRLVGGEGKVFATEVEDDKLEGLRARFSADNVEILRGSQTGTGLPPGCCDVILLRLVYHHFENPEVVNKDILRALKAGGRLVLIDFPPTERFPRSNVPEFRGGHGVEFETVVQELTQAGLVLVRSIEKWNTLQDRYLLMFKKPERPPRK